MGHCQEEERGDWQGVGLERVLAESGMREEGLQKSLHDMWWSGKGGLAESRGVREGDLLQGVGLGKELKGIAMG